MNPIQLFAFIVATFIFIAGMMFGFVIMYKINQAKKIYAKVLA
jgi:hypothetical protein